MDFKTYKDKVRACWLGKNIGGTLGAPFEAYRTTFDADFYTHDLKKGVLPNDDLDLQLIWLNAAEKFGKNVDAEILGDYWTNSIVAYWSEYGAGMTNLSYGILPPYSGKYKNDFKDSCGAFIRSEIWACLAPGNPDIAVKYAYEDACVDHAEEGVYAEIFCAALQSAAFCESDRDALIEIARSYIPKDCAVSRAIDLVIEAYNSGITWKEARKKVLVAFPSTFGLQYGTPDKDIPTGRTGYDAPNNIGLMILGWLYGEGDFSKSICTAANCGEDADCTAGTLAATLGIIGGTKGIEQKWIEPIGDEIKTLTIDRTDGRTLNIPETVTELTDRVVRLMVTFMGDKVSFDEEGVPEIRMAENLHNTELRTGIADYRPRFWYTENKNVVAKKSSFMLDAYVISDNLDIKEGEEKEFEIVFVNNLQRQLWVNVNINAPHEWDACGFSCCLNQYTAGSTVTKKKFKLTPQYMTKGKYKLTLEIEVDGFPSVVYIPIVLIKE